MRGVEIALKNRKANTTKAYKKAQEKWAEFCGVYRFDDGLFVNSQKLLLFTQEVILKITVPPKKKKGKKKYKKNNEIKDDESFLLSEKDF